MNSNKKTTESVIVIWASSSEAAESGLVNVISNGPSGTPRVYDRDNVDPRCGECQYFPEMGLALQEITEKPGPLNAVLIPLTEGEKWGIV